MKFEDVLPALREGKKIRREYWKPYKKYIYLHFENSNNCAKLFFHRNDGKDDEKWRCFPIADLIADDWEIVEEPKKVKFRDLTKEQYGKWIKNNCTRKYGENCEGCPFRITKCSTWNSSCWINHKESFSDKFLDQEIEVEE